jgi:hypothetical protein
VRRGRHDLELATAMLVLAVAGVLGGALLVVYALTH